MYFNVEFPTTVADAIIPVTKGCNVSFSVNQIATGDGEKFPIDFALGDSGTAPRVLDSPANGHYCRGDIETVMSTLRWL
jgi:hypothetical protein